MNRFAVERFLARLSRSNWSKEFVLKGALLFDLWFNDSHRPTRDADFLGLGKQDAGKLRKAVEEICVIKLEDAIRFDTKTIVIDEIREETNYKGLRVRLVGSLENSECHLQLDVGYGDALTSDPVTITYPSILEDLPSATLRSYPRETVFAEKLEAIVSLGMANSRMKDFYDLLALIREGRVDRAKLSRAILATFARRGTAWTADAVGLSREFATDKAKQALWGTFLGKNRLESVDLPETVGVISEYLGTLKL